MRILVLTAMALAACGEPARGEFLALSYNVAGLPEGISDSHPSTNHPIISPLLNDYHLVLVQEDFAYHSKLVRDLEHPHRSEPGEVVSVVNDGLNRFSDTSFGELVRERWHECFGGIDTSDGGSGDCLAAKGFSVATHELAPGVEVDVYNHHAEAGNTDRDLELLGNDFIQLGDYIVANSAGRAVIVGGDTNLKPERYVEEAAIFDDFLAATGLTDSCRHLDCGEERIDRFMFRGSERLKIDATTWRFAVDVFVDPAGEPLSDHDPLAVTFSWRERE